MRVRLSGAVDARPVERWRSSCYRPHWRGVGACALGRQASKIPDFSSGKANLDDGEKELRKTASCGYEGAARQPAGGMLSFALARHRWLMRAKCSLITASCGYEGFVWQLVGGMLSVAVASETWRIREKNSGSRINARASAWSQCWGPVLLAIFGPNHASRPGPMTAGGRVRP